jgi:hypothetical protein
LVARFVRDEEVVGSNPATPTAFMQEDEAPPVFRSEPSLAQVRSRFLATWFVCLAVGE